MITNKHVSGDLPLCVNTFFFKLTVLMYLCDWDLFHQAFSSFENFNSHGPLQDFFLAHAYMHTYILHFDIICIACPSNKVILP